MSINYYKHIKKPIIKKKKVYCGNCGKYGHVYKKCNEPITSIGIIAFKIDEKKAWELVVRPENPPSIFSMFEKNHTHNDNFGKNINILKNNNRNYNNFKFVDEFKNKIKFLLIRRKNTLGYIEFVRGRYEVDGVDHLISLFEQMTKEEIKKIGSHGVDYLWNELWNSTSKNKAYEYEYKQSKMKFNKLKYEAEVDLSFYVDNIKPKYDTPEWGFPKGRRNFHEKNIECAKREFGEETGFTANDYKLLNKIYPLKEIFTGTNGILYKHIYFLGINNTNKIPKVDSNNKHQTEEIGDIGWFTYNEAIKLIRPYHTERKKLLNELYLFIVDNILKCIKKKS